MSDPVDGRFAVTLPVAEDLGLETEFDVVRRLAGGWRAAQLESGLPPYEEVALGSLGRFVDDTAIVHRPEGGEWRFLRVGRQARGVLGISTDPALGDIVPDPMRLHIDEVVQRSCERKLPQMELCRWVDHGSVSVIEIIAFPLSCRWKGEYYLLFAKARAGQIDLATLLSDAAQEGLLVLSPVVSQYGAQKLDFRILSMNEPAGRFLGQSAQKMRFGFMSTIFRQFDRKTLLESYLVLAMQGQSLPAFEVNYTVNDAKMFVRVGAVLNEGLLMVTMTDIRAIKSREMMFRSLFDDNPVPMYLTSACRSRFLKVNEAATRLYGHDASAFLQLPPDSLCLTPRSAADEVPWEFSAQHRTKSGQVVDVIEYATEVQVNSEKAILTTIMDITTRKKAEADVRYLAHHDPLTGTANRVGFSLAIERAFAHLRLGGPQFALLVIDLDDFKSINDTLGHDVGDAALIEATRRLRLSLRADDVVARLGGDEFAILLQNVSEHHEVERIGKKIHGQMKKVRQVNGHHVRIGASIGVAMAPTDADNASTLLKCADVALYRAKHATKGTLRFFEQHIDSEVSYRRSLELDMRCARFDDEFLLHFQPIMSLRSGRIKGFECLARWRHPVHGMIAPSDFIPLAEATGVIDPLGQWIMRKACEAAMGWPSHMTVSVNVSPVQFRSRELARQIGEILVATGLDPQRLEVEITENVLLDDDEDNLRILHQLRHSGIRVVLDDFGKGYSAMSYLLKFPFSRLKIDRTFVCNIENSRESLAIIEAITSIGANLGIDITAEGVETLEQLATLQQHKCGEVQGYLFSPPVPLCDVDGLIAQNCLTPADEQRKVAS